MEKILLEFNNLKMNIKKLLISNENDIKGIASNIQGNLEFLRNSCANGPNIQSYISKLPHFFDVILPILKNSLNNIMLDKTCQMDVDNSEKLCKVCWELIEKLCVMNIPVQKTVWQNLGQLILDKLKNEISVVTDIQLMTLYNMLFRRNLEIEHPKLLELLLDIWEKSCVSSVLETIKLDFVHIILEYLILKHPKELIVYQSIADRRYQILSLRYISNYIRSDRPIEPLSKILLDFITKGFLMKSSCIITSLSSDKSSSNLMEVYILLEIIASASWRECYKIFFDYEYALFLNVGSLLQKINEIDRTPEKNESTQMEKSEVSIDSKIFKSEILFEFKKMLLRTLANLSFKNKINQQYAREYGMLLAICESSTMNNDKLLIKEWCILAIRNMCENCPENQKIIKNLYKIGKVPNDIATELEMDFSSL